MKIKRVLKLSSTIGLALAVSNTAFALDSRCSKVNSSVPYCIGGASELSGAPQKPLLIGTSLYGLIVKNYDFLVSEHAGGSDAEGCCGGWTGGIITAGHMSEPDTGSPYYKTGSRGLYVDNVKIKGGSTWQRVAGIMHYNGFSTSGSHRDTLYIDNVTLDIVNTSTTPFTEPDKWWRYPAYGVMSYTEGKNKHAIVDVGGNSHITVSTKCKMGEACFAGDLGSSGVNTASIQGFATANIGQNVTIETNGDMVHGEVIHTRIGSLSHNLPPNGSVDNKATVSTNGVSSNALHMINEWSIGEQATIVNTGALLTLGKSSQGINSLGYRHNALTNSGKIYTLGEDSSAILINERKVGDNTNVSSLTLTEESVVFGGYGVSGAGVKLVNSAGSKSIVNRGYIASGNYKSIDVTTNNTGSFSLNNTGYINGYQKILDNAVNVINQPTGVFNLENFDATNKGVAVVSRFSNKNTAVFKNSGTVKFDESMNTGTANIGIYTGIKEFYAYENSQIDLTSNNPMNGFLGVGKNNDANDRFTITNDTNNAVFYSNGGSISLNVDFTKANQANVNNRLADRIILDKAVTINNKPTLLNIVPTKDSLTKAQITVNEGILVIEVKSSSDNKAFALAKPLKIGNKEYVLKQINHSWYLVSEEFIH